MRPEPPTAARAKAVRRAMDLHQDLRAVASDLVEALARPDGLARLRGYCLSTDPEAGALLERWLLLRDLHAAAAWAAGIGDGARGL